MTHELLRAILKMQAKNAQKLVSITKGFINTFSNQENDIINLVTKAVMLEKIKQDICLTEVEVSKMETLIQQRIITEQVNIWAKMQKVLLQTWSVSLKCTCSNIKQSFRIKSKKSVIN